MTSLSDVAIVAVKECAVHKEAFSDKTDFVMPHIEPRAFSGAPRIVPSLNIKYGRTTDITLPEFKQQPCQQSNPWQNTGLTCWVSNGLYLLRGAQIEEGLCGVLKAIAEKVKWTSGSIGQIVPVAVNSPLDLHLSFRPSTLSELLHTNVCYLHGCRMGHDLPDPKPFFRSAVANLTDNRANVIDFVMLLLGAVGDAAVFNATSKVLHVSS